MELVPFAVLMEREDVVAAAQDPDYNSSGCPDWLNRFMVVTMMAEVAHPEQDLPGGAYIGSGAGVFYVKSPDWGEPGRYDPWTFEVTLSESCSFGFEMVGAGTQHFQETDSWRIPSTDRRPTLEDMGWDPQVLEMLERSLWPVLRTPAEARARYTTPSEPAGA